MLDREAYERLLSEQAGIARQVHLMRMASEQTLAQVAEGTGLSIGHLSDIERGKANPTIEALFKIANHHGLHLFVSFQGDIPDTAIVSVSDLNELTKIVRGITRNIT